jgi:hypothetical protein
LECGCKAEALPSSCCKKEARTLECGCIAEARSLEA